MQLNSDRLDRIDGMMEAWIEEKKFPGGAVLISQGGDIEKFSTYGTMDGASQPVEEDTLYRYFSMTKPITVAAAFVLYERGAFLLDDPINELWPEMEKLRVYVSGEGENMVTKVPDSYPTVLDLMMHTAGFYYAYSDHPAHMKLKSLELPGVGASISEVALMIADAPLMFEPGAQWSYGYSQDVLAGLVEYLAGEPYDAFVRRELFEPLGMDDFGYNVAPGNLDRLMNLYVLNEAGEYAEKTEDISWLSEDRVTWGGTGLVGDARGYWRFARMLMQGGKWKGKKILSKASVDFMLSNHLAEDELPYEAPGSPYERFAKGYGFGGAVKVMVNPELAGNLTSVGEAGWSGAASTHFWLVPEHDVVIIFFTQNRGYLEIQPLAEKVKAAVYQSLIE
ncbi:MAG: serine hydrolase domain-containing protein [Opitutales bacterium]